MLIGFQDFIASSDHASRFQMPLPGINVVHKQSKVVTATGRVDWLGTITNQV